MTVVHTTGVNWDSVLVNVSLITGAVAIIGRLIVRSVKGSVRSEVEAVVDEKVTPQLEALRAQLTNHGTRIAHLEGIEEGKRQAIAAAGVTKT